jgi:hypothetical protein
LPAQVDLRAIETRNAMQRLMNSYEATVSAAVTNLGIYEPGLAYVDWTTAAVAGQTLGGSPAAWSAAASDPILDVLKLKRAVSNQIGIRPNSMVIGTNVFDTLMTNAQILDRIKYTTADSIDVDMLARYFGLERGIRVGEGRQLAANGELLPFFPENAILLFYSPLGANDSVLPAGGASSATPAFAYTYQLTGTPAVRPEYYIRERRVVRAEITVERAVNVVGLGATGLGGSGAFINDILA